MRHEAALSDAATAVRIGTAGWSIPRASASRCVGSGTHLARYAQTFNGVEINSSFYRSHAASTYARWAAATPPTFRFSIKVPRLITHEQTLHRPQSALDQFLTETSGLADKRGPILIQLPPSLAFDARVAGRFLACLRRRYDGAAVCEPRHPSWFGVTADRLLSSHHVARAAADPARAAGAERPGGWPELAYFRLHGSPRIYWSRYDVAYLDALSQRVASLPAGVEAWVVFDNTAAGAAIENAWELQARISLKA